MSPTPVSFGLPTEPAGYTWEATDEGVAARYGIPIEQVVRFDVNTSPTPPALVERLLAAGRFETTLSEYPPSDYRRLVDAAAARYGVGTRRDPGRGGRGRDPRPHREGLPAGGRRGHRPDPDLCDVPDRHGAAPGPGRGDPAPGP